MRMGELTESWGSSRFPHLEVNILIRIFPTSTNKCQLFIDIVNCPPRDQIHLMDFYGSVEFTTCAMILQIGTWAMLINFEITVLFQSHKQFTTNKIGVTYTHAWIITTICQNILLSKCLCLASYPITDEILWTYKGLIDLHGDLERGSLLK